MQTFGPIQTRFNLNTRWPTLLEMEQGSGREVKLVAKMNDDSNDGGRYPLEKRSKI